ncbi:hypothetical protein GcC1_153020, partial [Golovinomyces cichoracearum]
IEHEQSEDRKLVEKRHNTVERYLKELLSKREEAAPATSKTEQLTTNSKGKEPHTKTTDPDVDTNQIPIQRNSAGRLLILSNSDQRSNLTPGEIMADALFPEDINHESFASANNKVILKPEWQLAEANAEVFTKLSHIQTALQIALIPYHLWAH